MTQVLIVLTAFTMVLIAMSIVCFYAARYQRWDAMRRMISKRFGYGVSKPWLLEMCASDSPRFRFLYRGISCYLKTRNKGFDKRKPAQISFAVDWPNGSDWRKLWLVSTEESNGGGWFKQPGVLHGAGAFQKRFFVYGRAEKNVAGLITPSVQHALLQLLALGWSGNDSSKTDSLSLRSTRGRLTFRKTTNNFDPQNVEKFMRCCLHIYDQMVLGPVEGLTYLEDDLTVIENVVCPICSGAIEEDLVLCSSCKSPHCRDCWEYNGRCATFACSETDFVTDGLLSGSG